MTIPVERLQQQSAFYFLKNILPSGVNVIDSYPISSVSEDPPLIFPTVAIEVTNTTGFPFEIGNDENMQTRQWAIEVFASTKTQRDDLSYIIFHAVESGIPVYDYNEGFPPSVNPTTLGLLDVSDINIVPIHVFRDLVKDLYWRSSLTFFTEYKPF